LVEATRLNNKGLDVKCGLGVPFVDALKVLAEVIGTGPDFAIV
jgi:hypothetical protein